MKLRGKVVLITGASDGIGAACARVFRERGARLSLAGRSREKLARVAFGEDLITAADLTSPEAPQFLVERTLERFGHIDVLVNNAGSGIYWPVADSPDRETRAMFDLNVFAPLALVRAAVPHMRTRGTGTIVNVGSIAGRVVLPWMPLYSASKSALEAMTDGLRMELKTDGIHAMLVCPGYVLTDFHGHSLGLAPPGKVVSAKAFAITSDACARAIARGVERHARMVVAPRWGWFLIAMKRLFPALVDAHLNSLNKSAEPAA